MASILTRSFGKPGCHRDYWGSLLRSGQLWSFSIQFALRSDVSSTFLAAFALNPFSGTGLGTFGSIMAGLSCSHLALASMDSLEGRILTCSCDKQSGPRGLPYNRERGGPPRRN